jgi:hypothetical protein
VRADPAKKPQRHISWSEGQINRLQADDRELRKAILEHRRGLVEKDRVVEWLKVQNARFMWEIDQQKQLAHIAGRIVAAAEEFKQAASQSSTGLFDSKAGHAARTAVLVVINIYWRPLCRTSGCPSPNILPIPPLGRTRCKMSTGRRKGLM